MTTGTEQIEVRLMAAELNRAWKGFVDSTSENFEERKKEFIQFLEGLDNLDAEMRKEIKKGWKI
jgi:hypothetical protein